MKIKLELWYDGDTECPCDNDGWKLYSFNHRHINYKDPQVLLTAGDGTAFDSELQAKLDNGLAFICSYFEHGQCTWMLRGGSKWASLPDKQWDGTAVAGLLVWECDEDDLGPKTVKDRAKDAENFLEQYTDWANGNCYGYTITDETDEDIDSCGSFIGDKYFASEIKSALPAGAEIVEITGEASWLAKYMDLPALVESD